MVEDLEIKSFVLFVFDKRNSDIIVFIMYFFFKKRSV